MGRYVGVLLVLLGTGCATVAPPPTAATPAETAVAPTEAPPPIASRRAGTPVDVAAAKPASPVVSPPARAAAGPPSVKTVEKPAAAPVAAPRAAAAAAPKVAAAAPLDLDALEARLRATKAIGAFTKISLKGKVNDLLDKFREHYRGQKPSIAELRMSYDLLMMKVLTLLQDDDQPLASAVVSSREAIWAVLTDEKKFAALTA